MIKQDSTESKRRDGGSSNIVTYSHLPDKYIQTLRNVKTNFLKKYISVILNKMKLSTSIMPTNIYSHEKANRNSKT